MKKRILSILLLCCMVLTMLPTTASAAETGAMDNIPAKFDVEIDLCNRTSDINIKDSKTYYIYSSSSDPDFVWTKKIQINGKKAAPHIFLDNVNIQVNKDAKTPAIELHGKASAYLYFINRDSKLTGATGRAAIQKNRSEGQLCVQVMKGTTVTCQGGYKAAGIGGSWATRNIAESLFNLDMYGHGANMHFGSQTNPSLWSGTIIAKGGDGGAGIGGGRNGSGEKLYFYSGKIEAKGGEAASGIGGSFKGRGRDIYIYGGDISAKGGDGGAGIGGGCWKSLQDMDGDTAAYNINIYGGKINAHGGYNGAGIGGGQYVPARDITITGGEITAHGTHGAAIGGGRWCHGQNITVTDAKLKLTTGYSRYISDEAAAMGYGDRVYLEKVYDIDVGKRYIGDLVRNPLPEDYKSIKIGSYHGKLVKLKVEAQAINRDDEFAFFWNLYDILIPNENGRIDVQLLTLPYVKNYGWAIEAMEMELIDDPCNGKHDFGWVDRQSCHVWACRNMKCQARDPVAPESASNGKHASSGWNTEKHQLLCDVCGHVMETDTKAPVLEVLKDGESYTVEDNINGNPGAYTFTVSDPALNGEASSGIKSVTINGEPQAGPTYRLPAPDGGNNDAGAEYTVIATDNAGNETTATVRTYRWHHVKVISPDGNGTASASPDKAVAGTEITLTATPKDGYRFKEWQVVSPAGLVITNNKFTMPDSNVEVKAIFEEDAPTAPTEHTVKFNANGGGGTMADVTGVSGSYTLPACGFTEPEGKQFKGWSTSADGSVISGTTYEVSSDTIFYAIWESKEYSIIVTDGKATIGAGSEISKAAQGTTITLTANAAPDGKVFDKWVVESGNTTLEDANSETTTFIMPDSEVSVKATYTIPHTHTYDQEIQKPETLKSAADCTNDAVYFKSCSCGEISTTETFTAAGTQLGHAWASDWSKDTDNHWKECSRCHEKKDEAAHDYGSDNICDTCGYDKTVPHTHNLTLVPAKAPTCTEKGNTAYYTCDGCDKWFEDATGASEITDKTSVILAATGHSASDWKSDNTDHWKECTVVGCGVIIEGSKAAHTAGEWIIDTPATATTSGSKHKECTVCGYTMATETIPATGGGEHTHSYGSEWKNDADNHWHECSCGDKKDTAAHTAGEWIIDTPASATTDGSKHKECTVCGYTMATETIPATGGGEHTHSYGSDWKNDATNHWHECSCRDKADKAAHDFKWVVDKEATATQKGSKHEECRVCGYKKAAVEIPATGTPTEPGKPTDSDSPQTGDNSNMILWIALLFVSGGVVIGITVYSKKKKENAE